VARIVAPAGEFIGAQTPEEIALSVLTSVVAARRGRETQAAEFASASAALTTPTDLAQASVATESVAKSCCGGAKKGTSAPSGAASDTNLAPMMNVEPLAASTAVAVPAKSSCCGG
jgi:xanthine dehydrogenase accessory factor